MNFKVIKITIFLGMAAALMNPPAWAKKEQHLVVICHAEAEHDSIGVFHSDPTHAGYRPSHLTVKGQAQIQEIAERLLNHGFDNRNIQMVYTSPMPAATETANALSGMGLFNKSKIVIEKRLIERKAGDREGRKIAEFSEQDWDRVTQAKLFQGEPNSAVYQRLAELIHQVRKKNRQGHVVFITHKVPSALLVQALSHAQADIQNAEIYVLPLIQENTNA